MDLKSKNSKKGEVRRGSSTTSLNLPHPSTPQLDNSAAAIVELRYRDPVNNNVSPRRHIEPPSLALTPPQNKAQVLQFEMTAAQVASIAKQVDAIEATLVSTN